MLILHVIYINSHPRFGLSSLKRLAPSYRRKKLNEQTILLDHQETENEDTFPHIVLVSIREDKIQMNLGLSLINSLQLVIHSTYLANVYKCLSISRMGFQFLFLL